MRRWRAVVKRRVRYRVTLGGALFAVAVSFTGFAAFLSANNLLFLVFSSLLALLLVSGFLSRLVLAGLEVELLLPRHVVAGTPTAAVIRVRNRKAHTPSFSIELAGRKDPLTGLPSILKPVIYFPLLPAGSAVDASVQVNFPRRGRHMANVFVISTRFPFGFLRRTTALELRRETLVYPPIEPSPEAMALLQTAEGELEAIARGGGRDFHLIRPWDDSDSARHVDWKSTAHTGSLQVREYNRDEQQAVEIIFDRRNPAAESAWFEAAVERCAWLVWRLDERGLEVFIRSQGMSFDLPDHGDVYQVLAWLAVVEPLAERSPDMEWAAAEPQARRVRIDLSCKKQAPLYGYWN